MKTDLPNQVSDGPRAVEASGLTKSYGRTRALGGADMSVPEGAFYLLVGPNGAGKTTTLRLLLDLARRDAGELRVFGLDPEREGGRIRAQVGQVPERRGFGTGPGRLRVRDLLAHHASYRPDWDGEYEERLCRELDVQRVRRFGDLSKGQARRVQLVMALAHRPPLLLLDEPTDGLDPMVRERVLERIADHLAASPTTVLLSTHHPHEAEGLADHVGVMRRGRIRAQAPRSLLEDRLRRYRMSLPEGEAADGLPVPVLRSRRSGRTATCVVLGDEAEVRERLRGAGVEVREVEPLTLEESALALLEEGEDDR